MRNRKMALGAACAILLAALAGCGSGGAPNTATSTPQAEAPATTTSTAPASVAEATPEPEPDPAPASEPEAALEPEAPAGDETLILTFEDNEYLVTFNFPTGIYYEGSNLYQTEYGVVPLEIFDSSLYPNGPSLKIGAVHTEVILPEQFTEDTTLALPVYDELVEYTYSDDETLPVNTFYRLGATLAVTAYGPESGVKYTSYYIPCGDTEYLLVWFFQNEQAPGAKELFERIIQNITIETLGGPA